MSEPISRVLQHKAHSNFLMLRGSRFQKGAHLLAEIFRPGRFGGTDLRGVHLLSGGRLKVRFPANMWEAHRSNSQR
jgi:hypothetical protein